MACKKLFCPVCGLDLDSLALINNVIIPRELPLSFVAWQSKFNTVGRWNSLPHHFTQALETPTSGEQEEIRLMPRFYILWDEAPAIAVFPPAGEKLPIMEFKNDEEIMFLVHQPCLQIARIVARRREQQDLNTVIQCLVQRRKENLDAPAQWQAPIHGRAFKNDRRFCFFGLEWDHDYYGVRQYWKTDLIGPEYSWENPLLQDSSSLTSYVISQLSRISSQPVSDEHCGEVYKQDEQSLGNLEKLPMELLLPVISFLPTYSVLSLRGSSKTLAEKVPITQRFWRDELASGGLLGFLFDLDGNKIREKDAEFAGTNEQWDWRGLAEKLSDMRHAMTFMDDARWEDPAIPQGLRNRCRIWKIAQDMQRYASEVVHAKGGIRSQPPFVEGIPLLFVACHRNDFGLTR